MKFVLLRVHDKINKDCPVKNMQCRKRGDVVHIYNAGEQLGRKELTLPFWRVLIDNSMTDTVAQVLCEVGHLENNITIPRMAKLDLESDFIGYDFRRYLMDDKRTRPFFICPFPLRLLIQQKFNRQIQVAA